MRRLSVPARKPRLIVDNCKRTLEHWENVYLAPVVYRSLISGGAICLVYALVALAAWRAQRLDLRERGTPFRLPLGGTVPMLALVAMLAIVATLSMREWMAIAVALTVLGLVYAVLAARRR